MKLRMKTLTRAILATSLVAGLGFSQTALAETANGTLTINAGLSEAMTVSCTALSFGITRVTGAVPATETTLVMNTAGEISGQPGGVNPGSGTAGVCTLTGSLAADLSTVTVTYGDTPQAGNSASTTLSADSGAFSELGAATDGTVLTVNNFTESASSVDNGGSTIDIGASLVIPANASIGGYQGTILVTVTDTSS